MPEYRKKAILSRIEEIQSLWSKLLEQKKDPILLALDVEEFRFMMYTYCQISIQEEGKNLLKLEAK